MIVDERSHALTGSQVRHRFDNGYGASVVRGPFTYGGPQGLFELAVLRWVGDRSGLTYDTPITDDVLGHLTAEAVDETLRAIEALPSGAGVSL